MPGPEALSRRGVLGALALAALSAPACRRHGSGSGTVTVVVHAAASLSTVLPRVAAAWSASTGGTRSAAFHFDATSHLAREITAGAPADVFFSADSAWMDELDHRGLIASATRVDLLSNALVLVVPRASAFLPQGPSDLAVPALRRLALAGEAVPAGRYARAALRATGVWDGIKDRVVEGDSVRSALSWVARGEADAAVVYATDAPVEDRVRVAFRFAPESHPRIVYPAAVVRAAQQPGAAAEFLAFCRSAPARALWEAAGFVPIYPAG